MKYDFTKDRTNIPHKHKQKNNAFATARCRTSIQIFEVERERKAYVVNVQDRRKVMSTSTPKIEKEIMKSVAIGSKTKGENVLLKIEGG